MELNLPEFFRNKWVRLVLIADLVVVIVLIVMNAQRSSAKTMLIFNVTPLDSKITLNGSGEYQNGSYQVQPGHYQVEIAHDEMDTKRFDVVLNNDDNVMITTYLTSDGEIDFYRRKENYDSFYQLQEMASADNNTTTDQDTTAEEDLSRLESDLSMVEDNLPIHTTQYEELDATAERAPEMIYDITVRASNRDDCTTWLCLEALMVGTDDESIVTRLLEGNDFAVEDYEIKYKIYGEES